MLTQVLHLRYIYGMKNHNTTSDPYAILARARDLQLEGLRDTAEFNGKVAIRHAKNGAAYRASLYARRAAHAAAHILRINERGF